jgi:hypothetical protein
MFSLKAVAVKRVVAFFYLAALKTGARIASAPANTGVLNTVAKKTHPLHFVTVLTA